MPIADGVAAARPPTAAPALAGTPAAAPPRIAQAAAATIMVRTLTSLPPTEGFIAGSLSLDHSDWYGVIPTRLSANARIVTRSKACHRLCLIHSNCMEMLTGSVNAGIREYEL
jgi:hypothetical protein